jgi:integrase
LNILRRLGLPDLFKGLRLKGEIDKEPTPYETKFVQNRLLAEGALDGLNEDARYIIYVIADTGLRPSEVVNLNRKTIHLNAKIPYVSVLPDGRRLKTDDSLRQIPLVGAALAAFKAKPDGFPRYRDNSSTFVSSGLRSIVRDSLICPSWLEW